ncbi:MAG: penicillin-binding transpeptidase domain-containing protein, partial [bacterium]
LDLPQEKKGTVPTESWKKEYLKQPWYAGDSINYAIGQGFVQTTPLQIGLIYAAIATGNMYQPYVLSKIRNKEGRTLYENKRQVRRQLNVSKDVLAKIKGALRDVVERGTGIAVRVAGIPAAGKTGTAENPGKAHAWFVCYAPIEDPKIAVVAFVAHGEHGDRSSAYVARDILKWYQENRSDKVYPPKVFTEQYIMQGNKKVPYWRVNRPKIF